MIRVRQMTLGDVEAVFEIEKRSFAVPWSKESFLQEVGENSLAYYFVIEFEDRVVGYIGVWKILDEGHITNIAIDPQYRGRKLATALLKSTIEEMDSIGTRCFTLEVRESNQAAITLYERFGFVVSGRRKKYYQDNQEDALLMWRNDHERV